MKNQDLLDSIPLAILTIVGIYSIIEIYSTEYIFAIQQHIGLTLIAISIVLFFVNRRLYKYVFGTTLLLGLVSLIGFSTSIVSINFFGLPIQILLIPLIILFVWINHENIGPIIKVITGRNEEQSQIEKNSLIKAYKKRFQKLTTSEIESRLDEQLVPQAIEALKQIKKKRESHRVQPNREEKLVMDCLSYQGFEKIEFEPDGNIPPDILVDGKIAIEVRRLNQNQKLENGFQGLEQDEYSIHGIIKKIMNEVSDEHFDKSAFVGYSFKRPLPNKKEIRQKVSEYLKVHKTQIDQIGEFKLSDNFQITVFPSPVKLDQQYKFGINSDSDSGGFVVGLIHENLKLIVEEKEVKTNNFMAKYPEWWLGVVDTIGYGLTDLDLEQFYELPKIESNFDKILLISPLDPKKFRYLFEEKTPSDTSDY